MNKNNWDSWFVLAGVLFFFIIWLGGIGVTWLAVKLDPSLFFQPPTAATSTNSRKVYDHCEGMSMSACIAAYEYSLATTTLVLSSSSSEGTNCVTPEGIVNGAKTCDVSDCKAGGLVSFQGGSGRWCPYYSDLCTECWVETSARFYIGRVAEGRHLTGKIETE
jgi:hypothetical protein